MNTNQKLFLIINIVGGILVLGSYYLGLKGDKGADALWGGVPKNIRPIYGISMLLSAIGYFAFFDFIMKNLGNETFSSINFLGEKIFLVLFILILGASTFWMPLTNIMVENPSRLVWLAIRCVLAIVGLASAAVFVILVKLDPRPTGFLYIASVLGILWFTIHTAILDAVIWPYFWNR
jgi:hypothetical protein